jgi:methionyl-tRNA formyltransferase
VPRGARRGRRAVRRCRHDRPRPACSTSGWERFDDLAEQTGASLLEVRDLNTPDNVERIASLAPDLILVAGWTRLLGPDILRIPRLGAIGFHASLLPRYRGRAPVNWALINGEKETGNTMFYLDDGVDTGDIVDQRRIAIDDDDDCATLYEKVARSGIEMLDQHLPALKVGTAPRRRQNEADATVMPRRRPEDGRIDWARDADALFNWVRAQTHPYPGAFTTLDGRRLSIWKARPGDGPGVTPGIVVRAANAGIGVSTGRGVLVLDSVQWEGDEEAPGATLEPFLGRRLGETR